MKVCCCSNQQGACGGVPVSVAVSASATIIAFFATTWMQFGYLGRAILAGVLGSSYILFTANKEYIGKLFLGNKEEENKEIEPTCIEDQSGDIDDTIIASEHGSNIFSKGGKNLLIGTNGALDRFFFSMCSTKESTIENFEDGLDKIHLFCTKKQIERNQILLTMEDGNSFITVERLEDREVTITVLGEHPNLLSDIITNEKYSEYCS
jgi:hypothetical protein